VLDVLIPHCARYLVIALLCGLADKLAIPHEFVPVEFCSLVVQVADVASFFLRRYAEIKEGLVAARYGDEQEKVQQWVESLAERSIGRSYIYPRIGRTRAEDLFFQNASTSVRSL
jgi:hypothetical protein